MLNAGSFLIRRWAGCFCALLGVIGLHLPPHASGADLSFEERMTQARLALDRHDIPAVVEIYEAAGDSEATNATNLCRLARNYCDLMSATNPPAFKKEMIEHALAVSLQAVKVAPSNATAHASLAVCYAKSCEVSGLKAKLNFSRLFKQEAERALALDPQQDVAYYLLGRWNYELANVGFLSRAVVKVVYGGLPKASYKDAIKYYNQAIELAPDRILHHAGLAMVYRKLDDSKNERLELEKCTTLTPVDHEDTEVLRDVKKRLAEMRP